MKITKIASAALVVLGLIFFAPAANAAVKSYNWTEKKAKSWNMSSLSGSEVTTAVKFGTSETKYGKGTKNIPSGYTAQGGTVTEKYYVFSVYKNDNSKNYIYIADRSTGKIIKTISGNWGHMNSFYYDWGSGQVRILSRKSGQSSPASKDGCLDLNSLKMVKNGNCASVRSPDYGVKGLTGQGEAQADGYVYTVGWDGGAGRTDQSFTWDKNGNVIFVYEKGTKKLVKSFYIPSSVVNGEIEDISIDGNGDVYLFYKNDGKKGVTFYRVSASVIGTTTNKNAPGYGGDKTLVTTAEAPEEKKDDKKCSASILSSEYCNSGNSNVGGGGGDLGSMSGILQLVVTILSGAVGIGGTAGIVWAGIIIMTSRDNAARLAMGKKRLLEIIVGMVLFAVAAGMILWLIPG